MDNLAHTSVKPGLDFGSDGWVWWWCEREREKKMRISIQKGGFVFGGDVREWEKSEYKWPKFHWNHLSPLQYHRLLPHPPLLHWEEEQLPHFHISFSPPSTNFLPFAYQFALLPLLSGISLTLSCVSVL